MYNIRFTILTKASKADHKALLSQALCLQRRNGVDLRARKPFPSHTVLVPQTWWETMGNTWMTPGEKSLNLHLTPPETTGSMSQFSSLQTG